MRCWWLAALLIIGGRAAGEDLKAAREHYILAVTAHSAGRYAEAAHEYHLAYEAKPDVALLYNIAEAHRMAARAVDALRFYRVYLAKVPKADNRGEVERRIAELMEKSAPRPSPAPRP